MFSLCTEASDDFSNIKFGEALWMAGHIGIYIGDGLAVECTPKWENRVQITACNCDVVGYNRRNWSKHGILPYVDYAADSNVQTIYAPGCTVSFESSVDVGEIAFQRVPVGETATPPHMSKEGYVFIGWYSDKGLSARYIFSTAVSEDLVLYAKWRAVDDTEDPDEFYGNYGEAYKVGDVNRDDKTNARDVIMLMKYMVNLVDPSFTLSLADINRDEKLNSKDVISLMRLIVSPIPERKVVDSLDDAETEAETEIVTETNSDADPAADNASS